MATSEGRPQQRDMNPAENKPPHEFSVALEKVVNKLREAFVPPSPEAKQRKRAEKQEKQKEKQLEKEAKHLEKQKRKSRQMPDPVNPDHLTEALEALPTTEASGQTPVVHLPADTSITGLDDTSEMTGGNMAAQCKARV